MDLSATSSELICLERVLLVTKPQPDISSYNARSILNIHLGIVVIEVFIQSSFLSTAGVVTVVCNFLIVKSGEVIVEFCLIGKNTDALIITLQRVNYEQLNDSQISIYQFIDHLYTDTFIGDILLLDFTFSKISITKSHIK